MNRGSIVTWWIGALVTATVGSVVYVAWLVVGLVR